MDRPMNTCEIVKSNRGFDKIVVNGYLMTKDKNRDDLYYWNCEKNVLRIVVVDLPHFC
jgi:hypothetical protein